ncbi:hypothetical protein ACFQ1S_19945 [Kibdelosporangium lantanae]|uniref:Streptomycin biosynthesis enzyme StrG n=1 Tax=Kibdelosporangium lantanae TaxID=1497396 RepID=A0ABW3MCG1_9PSEU
MRMIRTYDTHVYDFLGKVRKIFGGIDLSCMHHSFQVIPPAGAGDQATEVHEQFYAAFDELRPTYEDFLRDEIMPLFNEDLCAQAVPTFRVSGPGGTAVSEFHRDSDFHHQVGTVNFWVPMTPAFDTNTVWVESAPDRGDYQPAEVNPGEYLQFDALSLRHGNMPNTTGVCRVSFDFRVVPRSRFVSTGLKTVSSSTDLELGAYYTLVPYRP